MKLIVRSLLFYGIDIMRNKIDMQLTLIDLLNNEKVNDLKEWIHNKTLC